TGSPLTEVSRYQDVDLCGTTAPSVLVPLPGLSGGLETDLGERCREGAQHSRLGSHVEHRVDVIGRARGCRASLDAMQLDHLATYERPSGRVTLGDVQESTPCVVLGRRHRGKDDGHAPTTA